MKTIGIITALLISSSAMAGGVTVPAAPDQYHVAKVCQAFIAELRRDDTRFEWRDSQTESVHDQEKNQTIVVVKARTTSRDGEGDVEYVYCLVGQDRETIVDHKDRVGLFSPHWDKYVALEEAIKKRLADQLFAN